ncbi:sugar transporter [Sphingobium phenoxybenzoativorans]|uniref:sugar transporter n=1 Tax=Sphingobium phenoxybenzoativorans TaxID=1592790 RepID=UPI000872E4D9|nr:sugar transporter [Sphingobium phenoxybenzoativorans]
MKVAGSFIVIGIIFLLWNLMGCAAYLMQVTMNLSELAKTDPYMARTFAQMPQWAWSAYAVAVWGTTIATILLLMKRRLAVPLYAISLAAVVIQFGYSFLGTDLLAVKGVMAAAFPLFIFIMGVVQLLYARSLANKGIIK